MAAHDCLDDILDQQRRNTSMKMRDLAEEVLGQAIHPDDDLMIFSDDPNDHFEIVDVRRDTEDDGSHTVAISVRKIK